MIVAHRDAFVSLLTSAPNALTVFKGRSANDADPPFVVVDFSVVPSEPTSLSAETDWRKWRAVATYVGANEDAAQILTGLAEARLLDVLPVVSGRKTSPLRIEVARPALPDEDVQPASFSAVVVWTFSSVPA